MKTLTNILPVLAIVAFAVGIVEGSRPGGWALGLPIGAVCVGSWLVLKIMGRESDRYDEERRRQVLAIDQRNGAERK